MTKNLSLSIKTISFFTQLMTKKSFWLMTIFIILSLLTPIIAIGFGAVYINPLDVIAILFSYHHPEPINIIHQQIITELRLPRIILAFIAGAGLSLAGAVLQLVTRNPLADPYLFGISSGASFGAVTVMTLFSGTTLALTSNIINDLSFLSLPMGAFLGATLSVLLVVALSAKNMSNQVEQMLLAGVAISFLFGALSSLLLYFSSPQAASSILFWTLGSFSQANLHELWLPASVVSISLFILLGLKRVILTLQSGDETAYTLGVNVTKLRIGTLLLCSLITATLVANCGGIGFVGLMVPHTLRLLLPGKQPLLLITLFGGIFMIWIDVIARTLLNNQELPIGVITAAIGSVFFLVVLRKRGQAPY